MEIQILLDSHSFHLAVLTIFSYSRHRNGESLSGPVLCKGRSPIATFDLYLILSYRLISSNH